MSHVLVLNDDGYKNAGIRALLKELSNHYDVRAVAPLNQQSWVSKSLTRHSNIAMSRAVFEEFDGYAVEGTPADCAQLGIFHAADSEPDLVVSGINVGSNVGAEEILSSGTVGAALEAALQGIPAFASSIHYSTKIHGAIDFETPKSVSCFAHAAAITRKIIDQVMSKGFPAGVQIISINIPFNATADTPWVITTPHKSRHEPLFEEISGGLFHHRGGAALRETAADTSDLAALEHDHVSILPLTLQFTTVEQQQKLSEILHIPMYKA